MVTRSKYVGEPYDGEDEADQFWADAAMRYVENVKALARQTRLAYCLPTTERILPFFDMDYSEDEALTELLEEFYDEDF